MTAAELIDEARGAHESFTPEAHPDLVCLRRLSRAQEAFFEDVSDVAETALAVDLVFDAAEVEAALAGTPLSIPDHVRIVELLIVTEWGLVGVDVAQLDRAGGRARLIGRNLYLAQPAAVQAEMGADLQAEIEASSIFKDALGLRVTYVPEANDLTTMAATLNAPDEARGYLVGNLVAFLALRRSMPPGERSALVDDGGGQMGRSLAHFTSRGANEGSWYVSKVG